jgi:hypothetical protein
MLADIVMHPDLAGLVEKTGRARRSAQKAEK